MLVEDFDWFDFFPAIKNWVVRDVRIGLIVHQIMHYRMSLFPVLIMCLVFPQMRLPIAFIFKLRLVNRVILSFGLLTGSIPTFLY